MSVKLGFPALKEEHRLRMYETEPCGKYLDPRGKKLKKTT
jgi:hypothetical protein